MRCNVSGKNWLVWFSCCHYCCSDLLRLQDCRWAVVRGGGGCGRRGGTAVWWLHGGSVWRRVPKTTIAPSTIDSLPLFKQIHAHISNYLVCVKIVWFKSGLKCFVTVKLEKLLTFLYMLCHFKISLWALSWLLMHIVDGEEQVMCGQAQLPPQTACYGASLSSTSSSYSSTT